MILFVILQELIIGLLLLESGIWEKNNLNTEKALQIALRWIDRQFTQLKKTDEKQRKTAKLIISDEEPEKEVKTIVAD